MGCLQNCAASPHGRSVRIRITQESTDSIDGIQLKQFRVGHIYDIAAALGSYLLCLGVAELVIDAAEILPLHEQGVGQRHEPLAFTVRSMAADRGRKLPS